MHTNTDERYTCTTSDKHGKGAPKIENFWSNGKHTKKLIKNNKWNKNKAEKVQYFNSLPNQQHQLMPS
jgi:hypothetical protein